MDRKTSFLLYAEQADAIKRLTNEQRGMLLTALLAAAGGDTGPADQLDAATGVAFDAMWLQIGIDRAKYENTSEQRSAAGAAGAEARWQKVAKDSKKAKAKQTMANDGKTKQTMAKMANDGKNGKAWQKCQNENENENDIINNSKESKERKAETPADVFVSLLPSMEPDDSSRVAAAFASFWDMRKKIRAPLTDAAIKTAADDLQAIFKRKSAPFTADHAVAILNQSTFRAWRGLFDVKEEKPAAPPAQKPNAFHNFDERVYDYSAIMQRARAEQRQQAVDNMATGPPDPAAG